MKLEGNRYLKPCLMPRHKFPQFKIHFFKIWKRNTEKKVFFFKIHVDSSRTVSKGTKRKNDSHKKKCDTITYCCFQLNDDASFPTLNVKNYIDNGPNLTLENLPTIEVHNWSRAHSPSFWLQEMANWTAKKCVLDKSHYDLGFKGQN